MKRKHLLFLFLCSVAFIPVNAQFNPAMRSSGHSGTGANIDVKHHRFEWTINPGVAKRISGSVTTYFETTQAGVNTITFDFNKTSFNNANLIVKYHGTNCTTSFPSTGNTDILTITLPVTLANGVLDSVTIFYDGVPPAVNGEAEGCQLKNVKVGTQKYPVFYTLSESYEDKDWWPCKADMQDKIDSLTFIITTPSAYRAAANGVLVSEVTSGTNKIYTFKHKYPIASYLVAVAAAQYSVYNRGTVSIGGKNVPVEYYILSARSPTSSQLTAMDYCKQELTVFSNLFGDYPYKDEKYGMYEFAWGGGMEHQTFSAMGWSAMNSKTVVAHELVHQWFGDKVTMATWNDLWIAEGFARYGEALAAEFVSGLGLNASSIRSNYKSSANGSGLRGYGCYIPNSYITSSDVLWSSAYGSTVYERGAMVVSMLRTLMGDEKFFQACRNYLNDPQLAYGAATTADLQAHMEAVLGGFDLTSFFDSFVYGNGYPTYTGSNKIAWQAVGTDKIRFGVYTQGKSTGSDVGYYSAVIPLRVQGAGGKDTVIVLYDRGTMGVSVGGDGIVYGNSATPTVYLGFTPTTVTFDPFSMSLAVGDPPVNTTVVATEIIDFNVRTINEKLLATLTTVDDGSASEIWLEHSFDGKTFLPTGMMVDKGNGIYGYQTDMKSGTVFYRAKVVQKTGDLLYSKIEKITAEARVQAIAILSNPVSHTLKIKVNGDQGKYLYRILDIEGRVLKKGELVFNEQSGIDVSTLKPGTYLFSAAVGDRHDTVRFVVQ
ncbi:MAG: T9SS type A sorting domain-containing protein [Chitinophagaceae bacterium]|nr:T9SS type A sorting domain-containing protein [Chitinophagaceae bacterium]